MSNVLPPLGIDVSKLSFDVHLLTEQAAHSHHFGNTVHGFEQLHSWLTAHASGSVHACLEATGTYGDALALFLCEQGHQVSILNPARISAFRKSEGIRGKTDTLDAKVLALFCQQKRPALWHPPHPAAQQLQVLVARREDLQLMRQQERNRLENHRLDEQTRSEIQVHLEHLESQLKAITARLTQYVQTQQLFQESQTCLISLPGIAHIAAAYVLAELAPLGPLRHAKSVVAYAGIAPEQRDSGTSVHGHAHIGKNGRVLLRKILYLCALSAMRCDADFRAWAQQLRAQGKPGKVVIVAVMRKLLHLICGVLKSKQPYDARKAFPAHYAQSCAQHVA